MDGILKGFGVVMIILLVLGVCMGLYALIRRVYLNYEEVEVLDVRIRKIDEKIGELYKVNDVFENNLKEIGRKVNLTKDTVEKWDKTGKE